MKKETQRLRRCLEKNKIQRNGGENRHKRPRRCLNTEEETQVWIKQKQNN